MLHTTLEFLWENVPQPVLRWGGLLIIVLFYGVAIWGLRLLSRWWEPRVMQWYDQRNGSGAWAKARGPFWGKVNLRIHIISLGICGAFYAYLWWQLHAL